MSAQPTNDDFICPECGGRHFGRDTQATVTGEVIAIGTVRCHDEHGTGCRWRGEWPPLDDWERQMIRDQLRLGTAEFHRRLESTELRIALRESVKLQSHYAKLLNQYDGGQRMAFDTSEAWITRLRETKTLPPKSPDKRR